MIGVRLSVAGWLIKAATSNPPKQRSDWARAMQVEYAELGGGQLQWALGCLSLRVGWWFSREWLFIAGLIFSAFTLSDIITIASFSVSGWFHLEKILHWALYIIFYGPLFGACFALTKYRPQYWMQIGIGLPVTTNVFDLIKFSYYFNQPISSFWKIHTMDARWDVGLAALIGFGLMGALLGVRHAHSAVSPTQA